MTEPIHPVENEYVIQVDLSKVRNEAEQNRREQAEAAAPPAEAPPAENNDIDPPPMTTEEKVADFRSRHGFGTKFTKTEPEEGTPTPPPEIPGIETPPPELPIVPPEPGLIEEAVEGVLGDEGEDFGETGFENAEPVDPFPAEEPPEPVSPEEDILQQRVQEDADSSTDMSDPEPESPEEDILRQRVQDLEQELQNTRISNMQQMQLMERRLETLIVDALGSKSADQAATADAFSDTRTGPHAGIPGIIGDYNDTPPEFDPPNLWVEYTDTANDFTVRGGSWSYQDEGSTTVATTHLTGTSGNKLNKYDVSATEAGSLYAKMSLTGAAAFTVVFSAAAPTWAADIYYLRIADVDSDGLLTNRRRAGNIGPTVVPKPYPFQVLPASGSNVVVRGGSVLVSFDSLGNRNEVVLGNGAGESQYDFTDPYDAYVQRYLFLDLDPTDADPANWTLTLTGGMSPIGPSGGSVDHFYKLIAVNILWPSNLTTQIEQRWFGGSYNVELPTQITGISGTFLSGDATAKTITVTDGNIKGASPALD